MLFTSYQQALDYMGDKPSRPYPKGSPRSTRIVRLHAVVTMLYHYTHVVVYTPDFMSLDSGGWQTVTTKRRMNDAIGDMLYQKDYIWYVVEKGTERRVKYFDGIQIDYKGHILNAPNPLNIKAGQTIKLSLFDFTLNA